MRDVANQNFGYLISYILPGFVALWGISYFSPVVEGWLGAETSDGPTVGGFLYVTIGSLGAGLICSTVRWMVIDTLHHCTGIKKPKWNFATLADRVEAFSRLVADHYVYYKFYGNSLIAILFAWGCRGLGSEIPRRDAVWSGLITIVVAGILYLGSRDSLNRYYIRTTALLHETGGRDDSRHRRTDASDSWHKIRHRNPQGDG